MMGRPEDVQSSQQKATFNGATALIGVIALIMSIVSLALPNWGSYGPPKSSSSYSGNNDYSGHFGPFQSCSKLAYYSYCWNKSGYTASTWLIMAGIGAIVTVISLGIFVFFSVLHVAVQLQRREIWFKFSQTVFLKLFTSVVAVVTSVASVSLGAFEFFWGQKNASIQLQMGICYYIQIVLIFMSALLAVMSFMSYMKSKKNPLNLVPRNRNDPSAVYQVRNDNGVTMTTLSGTPYHGQPRYPQQNVPYPPSYAPSGTFSVQTASTVLGGGYNGQNYDSNFYPNGLEGGATNHGFIPASLSVPSGPLTPIQPVMPSPQVSAHSTSIPPYSYNPVIPPQNGPVGGVSLVPGGRVSSSNHRCGSMESLDSTQSLSLSIGSFGSGTSMGSGHNRPLRSSLKLPKNREKVSVTSEGSNKRVRLSIGTEQTRV